MTHKFLPYINLYYECTHCGYVQEIVPEKVCLGCHKKILEARAWFPDSAYEYAILLEDYHTRPITKNRDEYLRAVADDNLMDYFTSFTKPEFKPTNDWKPISILLFCSIYEVLIEHFLWNIVWVNLLPSNQARKYASLILEKVSKVSSRQNTLFKEVTEHKWKEELSELGFTELYEIIEKTRQIRNSFVHSDPNNEADENLLADKAKDFLPKMFELFVALANKYYHKRYANFSNLLVDK